MNQNIHQYLLTEHCIILLGVETTDTLSGLQQLENEPVPCGMASSLSGGQRHNANHPLIRSTPCVLFGKAGKIKGAVRADRMTSSGRQVTGGSVFSAESRSTISQNLLDSKLIRGGSNFLTSSSLSKKISENYILVLGYSNSAFLHSPNHGPLTQTLPRPPMDDQKYV